MQRRSLNTDQDRFADAQISKGDLLPALRDHEPEFRYQDEGPSGFPRTVSFLLILSLPAAVIVTQFM